MSNHLVGLVSLIDNELIELDRIVERILEGWNRSVRSGDDYYLDAVALNLHSYYSGLERIFERIANTVDNNLPTGENWHQLLLLQMTREVAGTRPAVLSLEISKQLDEFRGFRHVVRDVYTYHLDPKKIERLVLNCSIVLHEAKVELSAFTKFLRSVK